eukprot:7585658-Alexandrium_andersonii.AAC.1
MGGLRTARGPGAEARAARAGASSQQWLTPGRSTTAAGRRRSWRRRPPSAASSRLRPRRPRLRQKFMAPQAKAKPTKETPEDAEAAGRGAKATAEGTKEKGKVAAEDFCCA